MIGLATAQGGPTSHTAILARTLGIPAMVAGGPGLLALANQSTAILDGTTGRLYLDPSEADVASARAWQARQKEQAEAEARERALPARTRDGHAVAIGANVNNPEQVPFALDQGAEGVGLMRTEFLFLERGDTPSEDDQYATYSGMLKALSGPPAHRAHPRHRRRQAGLPPEPAPEEETLSSACAAPACSCAGRT